METSSSTLNKLAKAFVRAQYPHADATQIGNTTERLLTVLRESGVDPVLAADRLRGRLPTVAPRFGDLARACCILDQGRLTLRERDFVWQMCRLGFSRQPSPRQLDWLASIFTGLQQSAVA